MRGARRTCERSCFMPGVFAAFATSAALTAFGVSSFFVVLREKRAILFCCYWCTFLCILFGTVREDRDCRFRILENQEGMLEDGDRIQVAYGARIHVADVAETLNRRLFRVGECDKCEILLRPAELLETGLRKRDE